LNWRHEADRCEEGADDTDDASKQLQNEASIEDDASDAATIREKPRSKGDKEGREDEKSQGRFPLNNAAVAAGLTL